MNIAKLSQDIARHAPKILTGLGFIGIALTGAAGVKAGRKIEKAEDKSFKKAFKYYILPAGAGIATACCFGFAYKITADNLAAALATAAASGALLKETKDAVKEVFGEEGIAAVNKAVVEKHYSGSDNADEAVDILRLGDMNDLFYLEWEGSHKGDRNPWFKSSIANVYAALSELKDKFSESGYVSLYEWYSMLGLSIDDRNHYWCEDLGWDIANTVEHFGEYQVRISVLEIGKGDDRYWIIDYVVPPESLQS